MGSVVQRALVSGKGHCPCESAGFSCFHLQLVCFVHMHSLLSANICETCRPRKCFLLSIRDEGEVTQRQRCITSVWPFLDRRFKGFELYAIIMMSHDGFLELCFLQSAAMKTNKTKTIRTKKPQQNKHTNIKQTRQFSGQQSTAFIRKPFLFSPQVPTSFDCCQKGKNLGPNQKQFSLFHNLGSLPGQFFWRWKCGSSPVE